MLCIGGVPSERYPGYFRAHSKLLKVSLSDHRDLGHLELKSFLARQSKTSMSSSVYVGDSI